jgi:hypothetical protein
VGSPIYICGRIALPGEREHPTERERAGSQARPAKEGGEPVSPKRPKKDAPPGRTGKTKKPKPKKKTARGK